MSAEVDQAHPKSRAYAWSPWIAFAIVALALLFFQMVPTAFRWPVRILFFASLVWLPVMAARALMRGRIAQRKVVFGAVLAVIWYGLLLLCCHIFVKLMSMKDERLARRGEGELSEGCRMELRDILKGEGMNVHSKDIGWVPRPGSKIAGYEINAQGIRASREYPLVPPDGARRVLCIGDSFTFGIAVKNDETYPAHAEKQRPGTEWLNFGIPGGCLTQMLMRYKTEASKYGGKKVVIGFMTNDAQRTVNSFRPFLNPDAGCPFPKPFAKWSDGKFSIEPNPYPAHDDLRRIIDDERNALRDLLQLDYITWGGRSGSANPIVRTLAYVYETQDIDRNVDGLFWGKKGAGPAVTRLIDNVLPRDPYGRDIWQTDSPAFKAVCGVFDELHRTIVADGREPFFVIIPGPLDVNDHVRKRPRQYEPVIAHLKDKGFHFFDFLDPLVEKHRDDLSETTLFKRNHYVSSINAELAAEIIRELGL